MTDDIKKYKILNNPKYFINICFLSKSDRFYPKVTDLFLKSDRFY